MLIFLCNHINNANRPFTNKIWAIKRQMCLLARYQGILWEISRLHATKQPIQIHSSQAISPILTVKLICPNGKNTRKTNYPASDEHRTRRSLKFGQRVTKRESQSRSFTCLKAEPELLAANKAKNARILKEIEAKDQGSHSQNRTSIKNGITELRKRSITQRKLGRNYQEKHRVRATKTHNLITRNRK
ncbi:Hypothetical_protein [Hexamita inflata]|uniref:Hypothetical_protein n=1 Tax=Hexamita inflata TaxID=28002 RepID=A0AA86P9S8_9EUKA|nr:Hypothetical protein HINF_LOCUS22504 [Hexamita inflata]